jgi:MFS family permease
VSPVARHRPALGFWGVAFAFLVVMMLATLPSPLYGLYRTRDHLSAFMITVVFAIFAAGTIITLLAERLVVARVGRRGAMLGGAAMMMAAAGLLAAWKDLPGLLIGRLLTGVAVGLAAGVAIAYLIELRLRADPDASPVPARNLGTAVNVGALGIGPLLAGCLAQWAPDPLTLPYLVMVALGAVALAGLAAAPETGTPAPPAGSWLASPQNAQVRSSPTSQRAAAGSRSSFPGCA